MTNFSEKFKIVRKKLGFSQTELANSLHVDYSTISRIERNKFNPSLDLIEKFEFLCKNNNISFDTDLSLTMKVSSSGDIITDIVDIIENSVVIANRAINYLLIQRNYLLGKRIQEEILSSRKDDYGKSLIKELSSQLTSKYGKGFDTRNIYYFIDFYNKFPNILNTPCANSLLSWSHYRILLQIDNYIEREWYAQETNTEAWSVRTLQRNISSQYY